MTTKWQHTKTHLFSNGHFDMSVSPNARKFSPSYANERADHIGCAAKIIFYHQQSYNVTCIASLVNRYTPPEMYMLSILRRQVLI